MFKSKIWPIVAGLLVAFITMMIFEFANSFIYPFPENFNSSDIVALQNFTATLPWTAYILVFFGWVIGSFKGGYITTKLSKENKYKLSLITGIVLTVLGVLNNMMIGHDMFFNIIGLPMFIVFTYLGHRYCLKRRNII